MEVKICYIPSSSNMYVLVPAGVADYMFIFIGFSVFTILDSFGGYL